MRIFVLALVFSFLLTVAVNIINAQDGITPQQERLNVPLNSSTSSPTRKQLNQQLRVLNKADRMATKEQIQDLRQGLKARIASRAAELKAILATFRDQRKATAAARINDNLNKINEHRTDAFTRHLTKMSEILSKLETKVKDASGSGKDTTSAQAAIASAAASINTAKQAVDAQSLKDYTITATSEATIRHDARVQRDKLHTDLKAVHEIVVAARKALSNAIRVSASTLGGIGHGT